jgi:hypothetical protein
MPGGGFKFEGGICSEHIVFLEIGGCMAPAAAEVVSPAKLSLVVREVTEGL